jgi:hypothetical protein
MIKKKILNLLFCYYHDGKLSLKPRSLFPQLWVEAQGGRFQSNGKENFLISTATYTWEFGTVSSGVGASAGRSSSLGGNLKLLNF